MGAKRQIYPATASADFVLSLRQQLVRIDADGASDGDVFRRVMAGIEQGPHASLDAPWLRSIRSEAPARTLSGGQRMRRPENENNVGQANGGDVDMTATQSNKPPVKAGLLDRLKSGPVICAEGYLFELERRGYLQAGAFVPEAVVENPEVVKRLHEDFVHAGSDVVEAFTYYAHRQKLRVIGRENILEDINRQALRIARDVADRHGCLMARDICNTNAYEADDEATCAIVRAMF